MEYEKLIEVALERMSAAYAPYSSFQVGAAVLAESGAIYGGANVENATYGATVCAERNAICAAVCAGERSLRAIAICGGKDGVPSDYCPPCGICRQVMREFANPTTFEVVLARSATDFKMFTLEHLLPESFGPASLV